MKDLIDFWWYYAYNVGNFLFGGYIMYGLFFVLIEVLASAVVLIPAYLLLNKFYFHNIKKSAIYCFFSLYLAAVYVLVGMPNITYIRFEFNLNLIPILGLVDDFKNSILNILLFVPLGAMLPIIWHKYHSRTATILFGFCMSLAIEILQIFTFRATDINDLITNTFGTFFGFTIANMLMKKLPCISKAVNEKKTSELYIVCTLVFIVMFFVQVHINSVFLDFVL